MCAAHETRGALRIFNLQATEVGQQPAAWLEHWLDQCRQNAQAGQGSHLSSSTVAECGSNQSSHCRTSGCESASTKQQQQQQQQQVADVAYGAEPSGPTGYEELSNADPSGAVAYTGDCSSTAETAAMWGFARGREGSQGLADAVRILAHIINDKHGKFSLTQHQKNVVVQPQDIYGSCSTKLGYEQSNSSSTQLAEPSLNSVRSEQHDQQLEVPSSLTPETVSTFLFELCRTPAPEAAGSNKLNHREQSRQVNGCSSSTTSNGRGDSLPSNHQCAGSSKQAASVDVTAAARLLPVLMDACVLQFAESARSQGGSAWQLEVPCQVARLKLIVHQADMIRSEVWALAERLQQLHEQECQQQCSNLHSSQGCSSNDAQLGNVDRSNALPNDSNHLQNESSDLRNEDSNNDWRANSAASGMSSSKCTGDDQQSGQSVCVQGQDVLCQHLEPVPMSKQQMQISLETNFQMLQQLAVQLCVLIRQYMDINSSNSNSPVFSVLSASKHTQTATAAAAAAMARVTGQGTAEKNHHSRISSSSSSSSSGISEASAPPGTQTAAVGRTRSSSTTSSSSADSSPAADSSSVHVRNRWLTHPSCEWCRVADVMDAIAPGRYVWRNMLWKMLGRCIREGGGVCSNQAEQFKVDCFPYYFIHCTLDIPCVLELKMYKPSSAEYYHTKYHMCAHNYQHHLWECVGASLRVGLINYTNEDDGRMLRVSEDLRQSSSLKSDAARVAGVWLDSMRRCLETDSQRAMTPLWLWCLYTCCWS
eukprot:jgi/Chrzof1/5458/Cz16g04040.t1